MGNKKLKEVCAAYGVSRRAVQGYEKHGLVKPTGRNERGHLYYDEAAQQRIRLSKQYQDFGFTVQQIRQLFVLPAPQLKAALLQQREKMRAEQQALEFHLGCISEMIDSLE